MVCMYVFRGYRHTRTRIRIQYRNPPSARPVLEEALLRAIVGRARQARQVDQHRDFLGRRARGLRREVEVEVHFAAGGCGGMAQLEELAAEGGDGGFGGDGHGGCGCQGGCQGRISEDEGG